MGVFNILSSGDAVTAAGGLAAAAMSVASWVVILWKAWLLQRAGARHSQGHGGVLAIP
jgi:biopolymer transport protein ExbB